MDNYCIVQARVGSTRLPGKVLMDLCGKSVLERVLERVAASRLVSEMAVATGIGKNNLPIMRLCARKGIQVFCGSEDDVLDRFYQLAKLVKPRNLVRITADCPLMDPAVIDRVIKAHADSGADYTTNTGWSEQVIRQHRVRRISPTYPDGEDVEAFRFSALERAWKKARLASEREHVTPYMRKHYRSFKRCSVKHKTDLSGKRWTLDTIEDYKFIKAIYQHFKGKKSIFGIDEILAVLSAHPELENINNGIMRNAGYLKSLKEDRRIKR